MSEAVQQRGRRPDPTDVFVGSRLRMRRKMLGLSQEKLGEKLGVTFQQIQKYERGANRVGASRLQAMASALDVPVGYFFPDPAEAAGMPNGAGGGDAADFVAGGDGLDLGRAFGRITSPQVRRKVLELVRVLADEAGA